MRCVNIGNASLSRLFIIVTIFNARLSLRKKPGPNNKPASSSIAAQFRKVPSLVVICCYLDISSWVRSSLILWQSENDVKTSHGWQQTRWIEICIVLFFIHSLLSFYCIALYQYLSMHCYCSADCWCVHFVMNKSILGFLLRRFVQTWHLSSLLRFQFNF